MSAAVHSAIDPLLIIGLEFPIEIINRRINARVKAMIERGMVEEVRRLHEANIAGTENRYLHARSLLCRKAWTQVVGLRHHRKRAAGARPSKNEMEWRMAGLEAGHLKA